MSLQSTVSHFQARSTSDRSGALCSNLRTHSDKSFDTKIFCCKLYQEFATSPSRSSGYQQETSAIKPSHFKFKEADRICGSLTNQTRVYTYAVSTISSVVQSVGKVIVPISSRPKLAIILPHPQQVLSLVNDFMTWVPMKLNPALCLIFWIERTCLMTLFASISPISGSPEIKKIGFDKSKVPIIKGCRICPYCLILDACN